MKINFIISASIAVLLIQVASAQNVGIGTATPQTRLHIIDGASGFSGGYLPGFTLEGNGNRYTTLIVPSANESGIIFGNQSSAAHGGIVYNNSGTLSGLQFRTNGNLSRMVIDANGNVGIGNNTPGFPMNFSSSLGDKISLYGNAGVHYGFGVQSFLMQIHTDQSASDIAFGYGSSSSFTENLRIKGNGILQFPPSLAKKIVLYPGGTGDASLGVFGNELRIASDYSGADITFGYDDRSAGFTERFRIRGNGALRINGTEGSNQQVLTSTGTSSSWKTLGSLIQTYSKNAFASNSFEGTLSSSNSLVIFSLLTTTVSVSTKSRLIISAGFRGYRGTCVGCGPSWNLVDIRVDGIEMAGGLYGGVTDLVAGNGTAGSATISNFMYDVNAGTHTIQFVAKGTEPMDIYSMYSTVIVLPID